MNLEGFSLITCRQGYSDRVALLMAQMSELAYIKFNPPVNVKTIDEFCKKARELPYINSKNELSKDVCEKLKKIAGLISYSPEEEKKKLIEEVKSLGFELVKTFDNDGTQAILVENGKCVILAFRGTESNSIKDIKTDINFIPDKDGSGMVHGGFKKAYEVVADDILKELKEEKLKDKPLFITGHSLGGALAMIASKKITHLGGSAACYTFGSPRVGDDVWISEIKTPIYRLVNAFDSITMLPVSGLSVKVGAWFLGFIPYAGEKIRNFLLKDSYCNFMHGGNMRYLTNCPRGDYSNVRLLYSVSLFYRLISWKSNRMACGRFLSDHKIAIYKKKLSIIAQNRNKK